MMKYLINGAIAVAAVSAFALGTKQFLPSVHAAVFKPAAGQ